MYPVRQSCTNGAKVAKNLVLNANERGKEIKYLFVSYSLRSNQGESYVCRSLTRIHVSDYAGYLASMWPQGGSVEAVELANGETHTASNLYLPETGEPIGVRFGHSGNCAIWFERGDVSFRHGSRKEAVGVYPFVFDPKWQSEHSWINFPEYDAFWVKEAA